MFYYINITHSCPGAAEVEVTQRQQASTHVKINLVLHWDNE